MLCSTGTVLQGLYAPHGSAHRHHANGKTHTAPSACKGQSPTTFHTGYRARAAGHFKYAPVCSRSKTPQIPPALGDFHAN